MANGVPVYNPSTGTPTLSETVVNSTLTTTLSGAISAGASSAVLTSVAGLTVNSWIVIDSETNNPGKVEVVQVLSISTNTITYYPVTVNAHATAAPVNQSFQRQVLVVGNSSAKSILTATSPIVATSVSILARTLASVVNANTSSQPVTISFYDEAVPAGASAYLVYACQLGASQIININIPLSSGLTYVLSGACSNNIVITWSTF